MEHANANKPSELFNFIGGAAYGPAANESTPRIGERHIQLSASAPRHNKTVWHPDARRFYHDAPKPPLAWFNNGAFSLAVHVRRGDVSHRMPKRWLSNGIVALCVLKSIELLRLPRSTPIHVHILSEGKADDFGSLAKLPHKLSFHLNAPLMDTFHHMVHADALVMAASTMSDVAAWLRRRGRVFAHPSAEGLLQYMHRDVRIERCV